LLVFVLAGVLDVAWGDAEVAVIVVVYVAV
jgi:hypothetical protein